MEKAGYLWPTTNKSDIRPMQQLRSVPIPAIATPDCSELAATIARFAKMDGVIETAIPFLKFFRLSQPAEPAYCVYEPLLAVVAQGTKQIVVGEEILTYDTAKTLVTSVDLPVISQVLDATPTLPFLCLTIALDVGRVAELIGEMPPRPEEPPCRGMCVGRLSQPLFDAVSRLVRLLDAPDDIPLLAPILEREILYRLLTGDMAGRLRHIATAESRTQRIRRAIDWLKANYEKPLRIENLARTAHMSVSSLHHHFKMITAMSPLQYQKTLRLQEARRLMLSERLDAASAGHQVGYESPSQFSREYRRLFGAPPLRDIAQLR